MKFDTGDLIALGTLLVAVIGWGLREIRQWVKSSEDRGAEHARRDTTDDGLTAAVQAMAEAHTELAAQFRDHELAYAEWRGQMQANYAAVAKTLDGQARTLERTNNLIARLFRPGQALEIIPPEAVRPASPARAGR
ncbi:MAG TPA: hypothetical protein VGG29_03550 [Caulobacteraceae bacterium]|jgi:hypothetical protein